MFNETTAEMSVREKNNKNSRSFYSPGPYIEEAREFLKCNMDEKTYDLLMNGGEEKAIPSVLARIYLNESDWQKYIWIEKNGDLKDYYK